MRSHQAIRQSALVQPSWHAFSSTRRRRSICASEAKCLSLSAFISYRVGLVSAGAAFLACILQYKEHFSICGV